MVKPLALAAAALMSAPIVNAHYIFNICMYDQTFNERG
jgi:hypothetical protein